MVLSVAVSVDGYIDDATPQRLLLSNPADFDRVDEVRASCDGILVGAEALRRDDARLLVKSADRVAARVAAGRSPQPVRMTVTHSGELDPQARFFRHGGDRLIYTDTGGARRLGARFDGLAEVVPLGSTVDFGALLDDLERRGLERLLVEGGSRILTEFLAAGLADELQVAIAPLLVGDGAAPRVLNPASFPTGRMRLAEVTQVGDVAVLCYRPKERTD